MANRIGRRKARAAQARMDKQKLTTSPTGRAAAKVPNFWPTPKGLTGKIRPVRTLPPLPPSHIFFSCMHGGPPVNSPECPGCFEALREAETIAAKKAAFKESIARLERILNPPKDIRREDAEFDF